MNKYVGKIYDGRWEVIESKQATPNCHRRNYRLKNIFNNQIIEIGERAMKRVDDGETEVSKIIRHKMFLEGKCDARTIVFCKQQAAIKTIQK